MFLNRNFYPRGCPFTCAHYDAAVDYHGFEKLCPVAEQVCRDAVWLEHRLLLGTREDVLDIANAVAKIHQGRDQIAVR